MTGYSGIVKSVVKLGYDALQVTFSVHEIGDSEKTVRTDENGIEDLVYRVDIAMEDERSILFPDRELSECLKLYNNSSEERVLDTDWKKQWMIGRIADRICRQMSELFFDKTAELA